MRIRADCFYLFLVLALVLSGCSKHVEGKYSDGATGTYEFKPDGKVMFTNLVLKLPPQERTYKVDSDKVIVSHDSQTTTLTINEDGSLGLGGGTFTKSK